MRRARRCRYGTGTPARSLRRDRARDDISMRAARMLDQPRNRAEPHVVPGMEVRERGDRGLGPAPLPWPRCSLTHVLERGVGEPQDRKAEAALEAEQE